MSTASARKRTLALCAVVVFVGALATTCLSLSNTTLDALLKAVEEFDFAIFVLATDDLIRTRRSQVPSVSDNL